MLTLRSLLISLLLSSSALACDLYPADKDEPVYVKPLGETGLTVYGWSLDGGDTAHFETVWQDGADGQHMPWPLFYGFNIGPDGFPTLVLKDVGGKGDCSDIKLHWKREPTPRRRAGS